MFFPYACIIDLLTTQKYVISIILTNNPPLFFFKQKKCAFFYKEQHKMCYNTRKRYIFAKHLAAFGIMRVKLSMHSLAKCLQR